MNKNIRQNSLILYFYKYIWFIVFILGIIGGFTLLQMNYEYYGGLIFKTSVFSIIILILIYLFVRIVKEIRGEEMALIAESPFRVDQWLTQLFLEDYDNFKHLAGIISVLFGFFIGYFY